MRTHGRGYQGQSIYRHEDEDDIPGNNAECGEQPMAETKGRGSGRYCDNADTGDQGQQD